MIVIIILVSEKKYPKTEKNVPSPFLKSQMQSSVNIVDVGCVAAETQCVHSETS